jgi:predicted nucleotidyltransferase
MKTHIQTPNDVKERYHNALTAFTKRIEIDYYVLAVVLYGSLARSEAWERSDIDLYIILRDGVEGKVRSHIWLVEDGINIFAEIMPRSRLKQILEGTLQGSIGHSIQSQCKVLFSKDESIRTWFDESAIIGKRDKPIQLLNAVSRVPYPLEKAQKWFYAKHDLNYSFLWILYSVNALARVEVILNDEAPGREALDQALEYNPGFFEPVYIDLINSPKTEAAIEGALNMIDGYMEDRIELLFQPILTFLSDAGGVRTATELDVYFRKKVGHTVLGGVYDWLAQKSIILKVTSPVRLTRRSKATVDEPAYYYDGDGSEWDVSF